MVGKQVVAIVAGGVILFGMYSCVQSGNEAQAVVDEINANAPPEVKHGWQYSTEKDEMRGTASKRAEIVANDYLPSSPSLMVWKRGKATGVQLNGAMTTTAPMVQCDARTSIVLVKFDQGAIRQYDCNMGMSVVIDPVILPKIEKAKTMIVETDTSFGRKQYTFDVAGLKL